MTILAGDIKLVASQVMADTPNGGGAPTTTIIADAVSNALFPDISELDRAGGRVNLRKVFVHVQTPNVDSYFGANVIVAEPPQDPNVNVAIFSNNSVFDRRTNAQSRVEAYLNAGPEWGGLLYENHISGQRAVQLIQRTNATVPPIGRTLCLRWHEGLGDMIEQYVRITRVTEEVRTFTDAQGDYLANIVTLDISDALRSDLPGTSANRTFTKTAGATLVRDTVVADAASYYGAVPLSLAVAIGDSTAKAESIYTQLVPNSRTETPLVDVRPSNDFLHVLAVTPRQVTVGGSPLSQRVRIGQENRGFSYVTILTPLPAPGSVKVTFRAFDRLYTITDDGAGNLTGSGSGTVSYNTGSVSVTLDALPDDRSAVVFYWGENIAYTDRAGQAGFRAPEYSFTLEKQNITPGSFSATWTSGGVVKTTTDNGTGKLTGDATGEIVYGTGVVFLRPTAMLDSGGEFDLEYTWKTLIEEAHPGLSPDGSGSVSFTFASEPTPGTVSVQWLTTRATSITSGATSAGGSTNKSTMSNSSSGNTATTGVQMVDTDRIFSTSTNTVLKSYNAPAAEGATAADPPIEKYYNNSSYIMNVREPKVVATSMSTSGSGSSSTSTGATYSTTSSQTSLNSITVSHVITDDGAGNFFGTFGTVGYVGKVATLKVQSDYNETSYSSNHENAADFESMNETGQATTTVGNAGSGGVSTSASSGGGGSTTAKGGSYGSTSQKEVFGTSTLVVRYQTGTPTPTSHTETYTPPGVSIDLCPYTTDIIVPGSVRFTWMGTAYEDFEGVIYRGRTPSNPGTACGRLVYTTGLANLFDYVVSGSPTSFTLNSMFTRKAREHVANVVFNVQLSPLKPAGLILSCLDVSGTQLIGTSDISGNITGTHIHGKVDYVTGLAEVQFGDYVLDSGLTAEQKAEWWYDANDVRTSDSKIWKPWPVDPDSLRYNAVSYAYLPLDASILGIDPVRLPQDGRVPIFRAGGFAVVGHTATVGPATVSNGQTINCARERLSRVRVIGDDGTVINTGYTADLELGLVTFTNVTGYSQPVTVEHRVEDMAMVSDVQINGQLSFTRQLTHAYPAPGSYVSSALVAGDMLTYVSALFDQVSWTNVWSDVAIGQAATGTFNDVLAPIGVTNEGTVTERWMIQFTNTITFNVIGEHVGLIATGNTSTDCAPVNPATGHPYFTIDATGWGGGWSTGNVLRFNTVGTIYPVWVVRTIQQGPETVASDDFVLLIRGDVDHP